MGGSNESVFHYSGDFERCISLDFLSFRFGVGPTDSHIFEVNADKGGALVGEVIPSWVIGLIDV
jgi:hypothetical protein